MKIIAISDRKNMLKLDDNTGYSSWFKISPSYNKEGLDIIQTLKINDEVEIKYNVISGMSLLSYIKKLEPKQDNNNKETNMENKNNFEQKIPTEPPLKDYPARTKINNDSPLPIPQGVWDKKDRRIVRQNALSHATKIVTHCYPINNETKETIKEKIVVMTCDIAEIFEKWVYRNI